MIKKPTIIITSGARTGTTFFYKLFREILIDGASFHEPDRFGIKTVPEEIENLNRYQYDLWKIKKFGFFNITLLKFLGKWGLLSISNNRMSNNLSIDLASKKIIKQRKKFIESFKEKIYVESSYNYYGLIDVLPNAFENHKLLYIVRDGRDWVRSHINVGMFYNKNDFNTIFNKRITPHMLKDEEYIDKWEKMDQFEKLCWSWMRINEYAINTIKKNPYAKMFSFEKLFLGKDKYKNLNEMLDFCSSLKNYDANLDKLNGILEKKAYKNPSNKFPHWKKWPESYKKKFNDICEPLMTELAYGTEKEWIK